MFSAATIAIGVVAPSVVCALATARSVARTTEQLYKAPDDGFAMGTAVPSALIVRKQRAFAHAPVVMYFHHEAWGSRVVQADGSWAAHFAPSKQRTAAAHVQQVELPPTATTTVLVRPALGERHADDVPPRTLDDVAPRALDNYDLLHLPLSKLKTLESVQGDVACVTETYRVDAPLVTYSREARCVSTERHDVAARVALDRHIVPLTLSVGCACLGTALVVAAESARLR
jgi:hypothetical protein